MTEIERLKARIFDLEEKLHDRYILSFNGFAAANVDEPSPGDLKRVLDAYHICHQERDSLKRRNQKLEKEVSDYQKIAGIHFGSKSAYKALGDQIIRCLKNMWNNLDQPTKDAVNEYEKYATKE